LQKSEVKSCPENRPGENSGWGGEKGKHRPGVSGEGGTMEDPARTAMWKRGGQQVELGGGEENREKSRPEKRNNKYPEMAGGGWTEGGGPVCHPKKKRSHCSQRQLNQIGTTGGCPEGKGGKGGGLYAPDYVPGEGAKKKETEKIVYNGESRV